MVRAQAHAPSHLLHRICSVLESVAMSRIGLPKRRIRSAFNRMLKKSEVVEKPIPKWQKMAENKPAKLLFG